MRTAMRVMLPGGREVGVRAVEEADDAFILDTADDMPGARATALVARCTTDGDAIAPAMSVGDRETLLLNLRRLTFGESMECVLRCPSPSCGELLEFQLKVSDLITRSDAAAASASRALTVEADGARFTIEFRMPTAADVDRAAALASRDAQAAAIAIFERSVIRADRDGAATAPADLPPAVRDAVEEAMAAGDPQADVQLAMRCPACGAVLSALFDAAAFFLRELDERATRTLHDVHALAQHYHWSEAEILRMPARRRAQYIELVRTARGAARAR
jgi:hypothetical protein